MKLPLTILFVLPALMISVAVSAQTSSGSASAWGKMPSSTSGATGSSLYFSPTAHRRSGSASLFDLPASQSSSGYRRRKLHRTPASGGSLLYPQNAGLNSGRSTMTPSLSPTLSPASNPGMGSGLTSPAKLTSPATLTPLPGATK